MTSTGNPEPSLPLLLRLHEEIDVSVSRLLRSLPSPLFCHRGCDACCSDDLTVTAPEAERIRQTQAEVLRQDPAAVGRCAFLDDAGACRIYDARPYVCRTQGLPLRWLEETEDGEIVEQRDICPKTDLDVLALAEEQCWLLGPWEEQLLDLPAAESQPRVALRDLFLR